MYITCKKLLSVLALSMFAFSSQVALNAVTPDLVDKNIPINPNVIPPGTQLNNYDLLLHVGQDESVPVARALDISLDGFSSVLGWNDSQVAQFRQAAIDWFLVRFGIDFRNGAFDPNSGAIITDFGIMIPITYQGYYRVLASSDWRIRPYTPITPSSVTLVEYAVQFFTTPTYTGTYAANAPGGAIVGNQTDALDYGCWKIFLNYPGTNTQIFFGRAYYPSNISGDFPSRNLDRIQLFSEVYGSGYSTADSALAYTGQPTGNIDAYAHSMWRFPGAFIHELSDYNGFTVAPVTNP